MRVQPLDEPAVGLARRGDVIERRRHQLLAEPAADVEQARTARPAE